MAIERCIHWRCRWSTTTPRLSDWNRVNYRPKRVLKNRHKCTRQTSRCWSGSAWGRPEIACGTLHCTVHRSKKMATLWIRRSNDLWRRVPIRSRTARIAIQTHRNRSLISSTRQPWNQSTKSMMTMPFWNSRWWSNWPTKRRNIQRWTWQALENWIACHSRLSMIWLSAVSLFLFRQIKINWNKLFVRRKTNQIVFVCVKETLGGRKIGVAQVKW